jgi:predicted aminopeptidase
VLASYTSLVPAFERLFEREGKDFPRFYAEVRRLAALPPAERHAALAP